MADLSVFKKEVFNYEFNMLFRNFFRLNSNSLTNIIFLLRIVWYQRKASKLRKISRSNGTEAPPAILFSITKSCNLNCKGCYQKAQNRMPEKEMSTEKIISVLKEAKEIGSFLVGILGGEPFTRKDIFQIAGSMKNMVFAIFTNGMLIDDEMIKKLRKHKNIVPLISNEGYECETDGRRGTGVYNHFRELALKFKANHILFGVSLTATSKNFDIVTADTFIKDLVDSGCSVFVFMDYRPVDGVSNDLILDQSQLKTLEDFGYTFRSKYKTLYFSPAAEKKFGGCLGAGKGLIHINYDGSVEPCPFAPISDMNLNYVTLKEALNSDFMRIIRENHQHLEHNHNGGCTLWEHREWLHSLKKEEELPKAV